MAPARRAPAHRLPLLIALLTLVLGACSQPPPLGLDLDGVPTAELSQALDLEMPELISDTQAAALADGEATLDELRAAAAGWEACVEEAGYEATVSWNEEFFNSVSIFVEPTEETTNDSSRMDEAVTLCEAHHLSVVSALYERQLYSN